MNENHDPARNEMPDAPSDAGQGPSQQPPAADAAPSTPSTDVTTAPANAPAVTNARDDDEEEDLSSGPGNVADPNARKWSA